MDIIGALQQEESKLQRQLTPIQGAITALNGGSKTLLSRGQTSITNRATRKGTLSAAGRARIVRAAKARWAKIRADQSKSKKTK